MRSRTDLAMRVAGGWFQWLDRNAGPRDRRSAHHRLAAQDCYRYCYITLRSAMASHVSGTQKKRPVIEQHPPFRTTAFYTAVGRPIDARFIRRATLVQGAMAQPADSRQRTAQRLEILSPPPAGRCSRKRRWLKGYAGCWASRQRALSFSEASADGFRVLTATRDWPGGKGGRTLLIAVTFPDAGCANFVLESANPEDATVIKYIARSFRGRGRPGPPGALCSDKLAKWAFWKLTRKRTALV